MTVKERLDQHDKEIAAIRKFMLQGMKMISKIQEMQAEAQKDQAEIRKDIRDLAAAQKKTDASLRAFIESMRGGTNGHTKKP